MTRRYPEPRQYTDSRRDWNMLQVAALVLVIEAAVLVAFLVGQAR